MPLEDGLDVVDLLRLGGGRLLVVAALARQKVGCELLLQDRGGRVSRWRCSPRTEAALTTVEVPGMRRRERAAHLGNEAFPDTLKHGVYHRGERRRNVGSPPLGRRTLAMRRAQSLSNMASTA